MAFRDVIAPVRFFTLFPRQPSRRISEGQWVRKPYASAFGSKSLRKIEVMISLGQKWSVFGIHCPECLFRALEMLCSDEFVFFAQKWD